MNNQAVIVAATRTPITRAIKGAFAHTRAEDLVVAAIEGALAHIPELDPHTIDDIITGSWMQSKDQGGNIARRIAVLLGYDGVPGVSVNRACASSLQAIRMAHHAIGMGEAHAVIATGVESISRYEHPTSAGSTATGDRHPGFESADESSRQHEGANLTWSDPRERGQRPDIYAAMGQTAENVANLRAITREEQDAFALRSQQLTQQAVDAGFFTREITPVVVDDVRISLDESPRPLTNAEDLAALKPAFRPNGTVTAGNCCPLNDGAAAVIVMSQQRAAELGLTPSVRIVSHGVSALSPEIMGLGAVEATKRALKGAGMSARDVDLVEINEAFAAQVLPTITDLDFDLDRVNVHGGAIALGHPFGMAGARLTTTLINGLKAKDASIGVVTMCAAGGQGMAMVVERV